MEFVTELETRDLDISGLSKVYGIDAEAYGSLTVHWVSEMECRSWGLKSIVGYVNKVVGSLFVEKMTEDANVPEEEIDLSAFKVDSDLELEDGMMQPRNAEIDLVEKTILIS